MLMCAEIRLLNKGYCVNPMAFICNQDSECRFCQDNKNNALPRRFNGLQLCPLSL